MSPLLTQTPPTTRLPKSPPTARPPRAALVAASLTATAALLAMAAGAPASAATPDPTAPGAAYKAAHDTLGVQRLTPEQRSLDAAKQAEAARSYERTRARSASLDESTLAESSAVGRSSTLAGYKLSGGLHQSQQTSYWCGPATLVITQSARDGVAGRSQRDAATLLKTNTSGTAWYGININVPSPTGYPMADALNKRLPGAGYVPRALPYTPTATDKANFKQHIIYNTDKDYAIAGNAWEVPGGPHLVGHPNIEIFHWVSIDGYNTDTAAGQVNYLDPVGGVSTSVISWAGSVPKSARISSDTITTIMGGRGYVW
ncbi:hypothetical protein [Streptomyces purpureus]|uniref:Peptidase C39-like domain-containing protein n=1 Tax=Streptomyces purpureus TaxID=1951 RepID=A0A918H0U1_9ACTN|nr:hypothetical protein [Streptomyces purpureus]GGT24032.1 hypothetical protein GCM10014713_16320 [Streptomyces purpureus]